MAIAGTVFEAFARTAANHPEGDFLCIPPETAGRYAMTPRSFSYRDAAGEIEALRQRYARAGIGVGHRVGLLLENRPAMFFHWLALNALGASAVPINPDWRAAELDYLIPHAQLAAAIALQGRQTELQAAASRCAHPLVVTSPDLSTLTEVATPGTNVRMEPDAQTECALLYTSGTAGRPKGCVLTNAYFLWAGTWYAQAGGLCQLAPGQDRLLTPLPMSHMNAMAYSTMAMILTGGCIIALDRFHPGSWWDSVRGSRATIVHYLGVMPAMLLGASQSESDRSHGVRFGFGAGVSPRLHAPFEQRFGFPLLEAWAMTETGAGAVISANAEPRKVGTACFGRPGPHVQYRVVNERGYDAAAGEPGELWVRSATADPRFGFFREYLQDAAATQRAWEGGFFHTGDIVSVDADGDFHFIDRRRNLIRRSGENISAVEVEGVMLQHPAVAAVGVAAVPDEVRGDEVMACVVPRQALATLAAGALAKELLDFCLQHLAYYKAPGYVVFCERLPLTPTEKIQRAQLRALAVSLQSTAIDLRSAKKRTAI